MHKSTRAFIPALRFAFLMPLYDQVVRLTTRERHFKPLLIDHGLVTNSDTVLDVGCGTGTLLRAIAERVPSATLTGLDADPSILSIVRRIARRKLVEAGTICELAEMPFSDEQFYHVFSSLWRMMRFAAR